MLPSIRRQYPEHIGINRMPIFVQFPDPARHPLYVVQDHHIGDEVIVLDDLTLFMPDVWHAKISHGRKTGATIECGGSFGGGLDWVQRSSVAADNNRIYAEDLVTSRQRHFPTQRSATPFCHGLRKLVCLGVMPKLFTVLMTSSLKFAARSKIR
jgi:hypothetical protein